MIEIDIEMPNYCDECFCCDDCNLCAADNQHRDVSSYYIGKGKPEWCPLFEIHDPNEDPCNYCQEFDCYGCNRKICGE